MTVVCLGELLIDFVAQETGKLVGDVAGFQKAAGGAPANVAVAIRRLGHPSAFLGQVGDDPFGHYLADVLRADGVNIDGLRFSAVARTALAFVSLADNGERSFVFYRHPSADMLYQPQDIEPIVLASAKIFHFGSITLITEPSRSATLQAATIARQNGAMISYDPNLRLALWDSPESAKAGMLLGMGYADIVKISEEELLFLVGKDDVAPLLNHYPTLKLILVTRGEKGSSAYTREGLIADHKGYAVGAVDTTGAGDSFMAGILVGILEHETDYLVHFADILAFSNAVGAITTTGRGAIPSLPTRDQVRAFIAKMG
ncbi:MAG: PfkB family carbohydrate kinase [bacterium]|nr:PfkB family carbohydrate kinase [bacterium]